MSGEEEYVCVFEALAFALRKTHRRFRAEDACCLHFYVIVLRDCGMMRSCQAHTFHSDGIASGGFRACALVSSIGCVARLW